VQNNNNKAKQKTKQTTREVKKSKLFFKFKNNIKGKSNERFQAQPYLTGPEDAVRMIRQDSHLIHIVVLHIIIFVAATHIET
jgi:hypothetical protein